MIDVQQTPEELAAYQEYRREELRAGFDSTSPGEHNPHNPHNRSEDE